MTMSRRYDYPPILAVAGLTDPRVTYWEPAKWVARLRAPTDRRQPGAVQDQHGCRPRRRVGAFFRGWKRSPTSIAFALKVAGRMDSDKLA